MALPPTKELIAEAEVAGTGLLKLFTRITRILEVQDKHAKLIEGLTVQVDALRDAVHALQAREDILLARSETAATKAASVTVTDLARRIGHLEERLAGG